MSRTLPHNAWLFSIVLVSLASAGAAYPSTEPAIGSWALERTEELVSAIEAVERGEVPPTDLPQDLDVALSEAAEGLNRYLDEHPDDVGALILSARLERIQDLKEAVVWSPSASEQPPKRGLDAAHERLDRALALDSGNAEAHYWHARLYGIQEPVIVDGVLWMQPRNLDKAIEHAQRAVELASTRSDYRETLGLYLYDAGRYQDAVTVTRELADGPHLIHLLLTDMEALELPESATYSPTRTQALISLQKSRGRFVGIAYPQLRLRVYTMPVSASELDRFLAQRWPDVSLFRTNREESEGMTTSQYFQSFDWREDGLNPTAQKNQMPEDESFGLGLFVTEVKNPTQEMLEEFDMKPVDAFCQIVLMNFR
jgi:tetratricopeptide (TPR) repeat protein